MLGKECLFGLLVDSMGKVYFPITNAFLENTGDTFEFNTRVHAAPYKPVLEKSALVTPYLPSNTVVCTLPDGSTISNLSTNIILPKGTVITCPNAGSGYAQLVSVKYITKWVELPEMTQGGGNKVILLSSKDSTKSSRLCYRRIM